jgi:hypothetical protein
MQNDKKKLERQHRRNLELEQQLSELKTELTKEQLDREGGFARAKDLIQELESIKTDWLESLAELKRLQESYRILIHDIKKGKRKEHLHGLFRL